MPPKRHIAMPGDIFGYHNWERVGTTGIKWLEAKDADKYPVIHRIALHDKKIIWATISVVPRLKNCDPDDK